MARTGPEDNLVAVKTTDNSSAYVTAGPDWVILKEQRLKQQDLHYKDEAEADRFFAQAATAGPSAQILRDLMTQRDICAKQMYMHQVRGRPERSDRRGWAAAPRALPLRRAATAAAAAARVTEWEGCPSQRVKRGRGRRAHGGVRARVRARIQ